MKRFSVVERRGKDMVQICARDESCQPGSLHEIFTWKYLTLDACGRSVTQATRLSKTTCTSLEGSNVSVMSRMSSGMSMSMSWKNVVDNCSSRGVSIRARSSSRYSLTPLNKKCVREGRTERVGGNGRRLSCSGQD